MDTIVSAEYLAVAEAAVILSVSESTIWRWIRRGDLPAYRIGPRSVRVKREDLERRVTPFVEFQSMQDEEPLEEVLERLKRPKTKEEIERGLAAAEHAARLAAEITKRRGGALLSSSWELVDEVRDERTRQLEEISDQYEDDTT